MLLSAGLFAAAHATILFNIQCYTPVEPLDNLLLLLLLLLRQPFPSKFKCM